MTNRPTDSTSDPNNPGNPGNPDTGLSTLTLHKMLMTMQAVWENAPPHPRIEVSEFCPVGTVYQLPATGFERPTQSGASTPTWIMHPFSLWSLIDQEHAAGREPLPEMVRAYERWAIRGFASRVHPRVHPSETCACGAYLIEQNGHWVCSQSGDQIRRTDELPLSSEQADPHARS